MYYKHKNLDNYIMVTPVRVVKTYSDSVVQYTSKDYCFKLESDVDTSIYDVITEHEFRFAFIQVIENLTQTLKTLNHAEVSIN
jgi:hypothetical protein